MKTKLALLTLVFLLAFAHAGSPACAVHDYGEWYPHAAEFYISKQPAHQCRICGVVQNAGGRFMELARNGPDGVPGGQGKLTTAEAEAQVEREVLVTFGTWKQYDATAPR